MPLASDVFSRNPTTRGPLVSIVMPTHNRAALLEQALQSVAAQDHRPIEVVVVDDASNDRTGEVLERIRLIFEKSGIILRVESLRTKGGPAAARNLGIGLATAPLLAFFDSDDLWEPTFLSKLVGLLERHPECGLAFSGIAEIDANGRVVQIRDPGLPAGSEEGVLHTPFDQCAKRFLYWGVNTVVRRSVLDAAGSFDTALVLWSDVDVWYRTAKLCDVAYTRLPLAQYRRHDSNITGGRWKGNIRWQQHLLLVSLRHLDDVRTPEARAIMVERIANAQVLLQKQILREGRRDAELTALLQPEVAPMPASYRLGLRMLRAPMIVGRAYLSIVDSLGPVRRLGRRRSDAPFDSGGKVVQTAFADEQPHSPAAC